MNPKHWPSGSFLFRCGSALSLLLFAMTGCGAPAIQETPITQTASKPPAVEESPAVTEPPPGPAPDGMVWVPGGAFVMGNAEGNPDEQAEHAVALDGFWMDRTEVTNAQFQNFVEATRYETEAEKPPKIVVPPDSPLANATIQPELNHPGSICFRPPPRDGLDAAKGAYNWWAYIPGANWKHPDGPDSSIENKLDHPVVHVSWNDAVAYCQWAGKRLPTEPNGNTPPAAASPDRHFPGATNATPVASGSTTSGKVSSPSPMKKPTASERRPRWDLPAQRLRPGGSFGQRLGMVQRQLPARLLPPQSRPENPPGPDSSEDPDEPGIPNASSAVAHSCAATPTAPPTAARPRGKGEPTSGVYHCGFRCVKTPEPADKPARSASE